MASQLNPTTIGTNIQAQLTTIVSPVKVYASFNRNFATEPKFLTWNLRNIHQPVYTGQTQSNKGIDRPVFQINVFAQAMTDAFSLSNSILQSLHGYTGKLGGNTGTWVAKADVYWLYNTYDNELGLNQIVLDCTLDIPT
jgi:hypothetical protein